MPFILSQRGLERREPFDLAAVTDEARLARQPEAGSPGLKVTANLGAAPVPGKPGLTGRLVASLVDNAKLIRGRCSLPAPVLHGQLAASTGVCAD